MSAELVFATALARAVQPRQSPAIMRKVNAVRITQDEGFKKVLTDALGVGEDHTGSGGRKYVKDLIDKKLIDNLYMEIPSETGKLIPDYTDDQLKSRISDLYGNTAAPLWELVVYAKRNKVWIGCYDVAGGDEGVISLNARDELVAEGMNRVMQQYVRAKNVILYGALHFEDPRQGREKKTIAYLCNLDYVLFDR
jgi:hypothetical protein